MLQDNAIGSREWSSDRTTERAPLQLDVRRSYDLAFDRTNARAIHWGYIYIDRFRIPSCYVLYQICVRLFAYNVRQRNYWCIHSWWNFCQICPTSVKTESLIHGIHTSGTTCQIEADKSCYDRKTLHDYMQHVSNSLMVAQHTQRQVRLVLRPLNIVYHSCDQTKRCTTFVRTVVRCIAIILIALVASE